MYRVWLEEVLGFKLRGDRLSIEPAMPEEWPGYVITVRFGQTEYRIEVQNGGEASNEGIRLVDDRKSHTIQILTGPQPAGEVRDTAGTPSVAVSCLACCRVSQE